MARERMARAQRAPARRAAGPRGKLRRDRELPGHSVEAWASGAKLTWAQVEGLRAQMGIARSDLMVLAEVWRLHPETLRRAYLGRSWAQPQARRLPEEFKRCIICGSVFPRSFSSGRRRSPAHWQQKVTCGPSCAVRNHWRRGMYASRGQ